VRLARVGPNELREEPSTPRWHRFATHLSDPLVLLLIVAALIALAVWALEGASGAPIETIVILAIVVLNAALGYLQEARAERIVAALRSLTEPMAAVVRGGAPTEVPAREVVPGDLLVIESGDAIAADARVLFEASLTMAESALTGESEPVEKDAEAIPAETPVADRSNMVFRGTVAASGRGRAIVTATGMATELGSIARLVGTVREPVTPLQREIGRIGRVIGLAVMGVAIVVIVSLLMTSDVHGSEGLVDVLLIGVSLAVAAVPEGLAAILTIVMALGVQRMARRHAIIRTLSAVETLGAATTICSDKTGTLTRNEMTVRRVVTPSGAAVFSGSGYRPHGEVTDESGAPLAGAPQAIEVRDLLHAAVHASNAVVEEADGAWSVHGNPTEGALIAAAGKLDEPPATTLRRVDEVPFSSRRKLMSTVHEVPDRPGGRRVFTKGAPDVLLERCTHERLADAAVPLTVERRTEIARTVEDLAESAMRTLALGERWIEVDDEVGEHLERDLVYLGIVGMIDPPRDEAAASVEEARAAGVRLVMITGDHPITALAIAREVGIASDEDAIVTGAELDRMDDEELASAVRLASVYARVSPEHKLRIVRALQHNGEVVAMTGDGVNDAPALKTADIGVAMGVTGTDVAMQASDMVLADDNVATIVAAIEEGRAIFANIRKFVRYLLSSNTGEVMTMVFGIVFASALGLAGDASGIVTPLLAVQILWINLLTDAAPALAVGVDPPDVGVMRRSPRPRAAHVIDGPMWVGIGVNGFAMAAATLFVADLVLPGGFVQGSGSPGLARTMSFTVLVLAQLVNVFNARSDRESAFRHPFSNPLLWAAVALSAALQVAVIYVPFLNTAFDTQPLTAVQWSVAIVAASVVLWASEVRKLVARRYGPT